MSRWYRAYAGTVKDDKLAEAAIVAGCSRSVVIAVWHSLLESAAEVGDGGRFETTARRVAAVLGEPLATIDAVFMALAEIGMVEDGSIAAWKRRQYESDTSTERVRKHREAKRNANPVPGNANETFHHRCVTPPEAETETEDTASAVSSARAGPSYDQIESQCRKAAGLENDPSPSLLDLSPINQLLAKGADLERDIVPVIRAKARPGVRSWRFFVPAIVEAMTPAAGISGIKPSAPPVPDEDRWARSLKSHAMGIWSDHWGPEPGKPGCRIPDAFVAQWRRANGKNIAA